MSTPAPFDPDAYLQSTPSEKPFDPDSHLNEAVPMAARTQTPEENPGADEVSAETGAGEAALSLGTGALASFPAAVAYVGGALGMGKGSLENARAVQQALTYQPRTEQGKGALQGLDVVAGAPGRWALNQLDEIEPSGQLSAAAADIAERTASVSPLLAEGAAALKGTGITTAALAKKPATAIEPHPLQPVADLERQRLADVDTRLSQQGIALPSDRQISPIVKASNNVVGKDLKLPTDAPMTEGMIEAGIKQNALPVYGEVRKIAPWEASPAYEADAKGIKTDLLDPDYKIPMSGELDGKETVRLSQGLRNSARDYWKAYGANPDPAIKAKAIAHDSAAEAVENEFERHVTDVPGLSDSWDAARTYVAKAKNVEAALDGAGNVRPTMLKSQLLKGKPLSGGIQDLAIAAAKYPDYFKATPAMPPQVGLPRRVAAKFAPSAGTAAGAAIGGSLGFPTTGAVLGNEAGAKLSSILNPYPR